MPARVSSVVAAILVLSGCATTERREHTQELRVVTVPEDASVFEEDSSGRHLLGPAPATFRRSYTEEETRFDRRCWITPAAGAGLFGVGAGLLSAGVGGSATKPSPSGLALLVIGSIPMTFGAMYCLVASFMPEETHLVPAVEEAKIGASRDGYREAVLRVMVPGPTRDLSLVLEKDDGWISKGGERGTVLAVFDIENATPSIGAEVSSRLTEYLVARVASAPAFHVVPREQLRARLVAEKAESFRPCYDEACQIELGKAVAAQKSLATKLLPAGDRCTLVAVLYDLRTETTDRAATETVGCAEAELMRGVDGLVAELRGDQPG